MAVRSHQRPGFSRKAQYSVFAGYVLAILGVVIGLGLAVLSVADPKGFAALRRAAAEISAPPSRATKSVTGNLAGVDDAIASFWNAGQQNRQLRKSVTDLRRRLVATSALEEENRQLRAMLDLQKSDDSVLFSTRLLSSSSTSARRFAVLDAGRNRGVEAGQPIRAADGLIGRVLDVGPTVSRVLLLTDGESIVPVRRASDGMPALSTGLVNGDIEIRATTVGLNPFKPGDILVTSGSGGLYRPNIPVAIVARKVGDVAIARPLADPSRVDYVQVLRSYAVSEAALPGATRASEPNAAAAAPVDSDR